MQICLANNLKVHFSSQTFNGKMDKKDSKQFEYTYGSTGKMLTAFTPVDMDHQHEITGLAKRIGVNLSRITENRLAGMGAGEYLPWRVAIDMGIHASSSDLTDNGFPKSALKGFIRIRDDFPQGILENLRYVYKHDEEDVKLTLQFNKIQCIPEGDCVTVWPPQLSFTEEYVICIPPMMWYGVEKFELDVAGNINQDYWKLTDRICGWNVYINIIATVPDYYADADSNIPDLSLTV